MVASRPIRAGETIFVESPLTFGPSDTGKPVCAGCYKRLRKYQSECERCGMPVCKGGKCEEIEEHRDFECREFQEAGFRADAKQMDYKGEG